MLPSMGVISFTTFQTITVPCPGVTADSLILLTVQSATGVSVPGACVVSRVPGVSFDVRSGKSGDTVTVGWMVIAA